MVLGDTSWPNPERAKYWGCRLTILPITDCRISWEKPPDSASHVYYIPFLALIRYTSQYLFGEPILQDPGGVLFLRRI